MSDIVGVLLKCKKKKTLFLFSFWKKKKDNFNTIYESKLTLDKQDQ